MGSEVKETNVPGNRCSDSGLVTPATEAESKIQNSPLPMFLSADGARIDLWRLEPTRQHCPIRFGVCYRFIFSRFAAGSLSTPSLPKLRPLHCLTWSTSTA